ncbi:MAG: ATP-dependent Clp protease adaptor ClpS [Bacteroidetes bacterium]|jgi:ATP-dependent Clp protease adaptor protein ClpS|nr:ATP-dependent Clp protease adaptor ClpS [Bacteroidota bacterium]
MKAQVQELLQPVTLLETEAEKVLVLYNDDVNTFDWVIQCLMEVCGHTAEQAEQCAWFVHYKGKYAVKHGSYTELEPRCTALLDRRLSAEIH